MTDDKKPDGWVVISSEGVKLHDEKDDFFVFMSKPIALGQMDFQAELAKGTSVSWRVRPVKLVYLDEEK